MPDIEIKGVSTSTAGFLGATSQGPGGGIPPLLTSLLGFERIYGAAGALAQSVRAYFANGGQRLYIASVSGSQPSDYQTALRSFEELPDISVVAAPGAPADAANLLIAHCERMRYRFAVIDSGSGQSATDVTAYRAQFDSSCAALYYPWVLVKDPATGKQISLPPSGFVAGIYARHDAAAGVHKAPANEPLSGAVGLEDNLTAAEQEVLGPAGVNTLRCFPIRGCLVWGARTLSSDPEGRYVNIRRYLIYLEHSIDSGTQWAVFEPNSPALWDTVRQTVENFLLNEWRNGALLGTKPSEAFFVRCDRTTMTQEDLDNGRLIVLIGVATLRPAEFVIFRIGQWTANCRNCP